MTHVYLGFWKKKHSLERASLEKLTAGNYQAFLAWVQGANVTHLELQGIAKEISLFHLGKALERTNIKTLELSENDIDAYRAKALIQGLKNTALTKLTLDKNLLGPKGAKTLIESLQGTSITSLSIRANQLGPRGAQAFTALRGSAIDTLDVSQNQLTEAGALILIQALKGTPVTCLDLSYNQINSEGVAAIALALQDTKVTTLVLKGNSLGPASAKHFASLVGSKVTTLNLSGNDLGADGTQMLITALAGSAVDNLDLTRNKIDDGIEAGSLLALAHTAITQLNLAENRISDRFVQALAQGLPARLTSLELWISILTNTGLAALIQSFKNTQVKTIDLRYIQYASLTLSQLIAQGLFNIPLLAHLYLGYRNEINSTAASELAKALPYSQIKTLHVHLEVGAVEILLSSLKDTAITTLSLAYKGSCDEDFCSIAKSLIGTSVSSFHLYRYGDKIGELGPQRMQQFLTHLAHTKVTTLGLRYPPLGITSIKALAQGLASTSITRLDLRGNSLDAKAAIELGLGLVHAKLSYLDLSGNRLGAQGVQALIKALAGSSITALNLLGNNLLNSNIDDEVATQLSPAIAHTHLVDVVLGFFNFSLAQALRANLQKLIFAPYWALRLRYLSEEQKASFYPKPALSPQATAQEQLQYAAGILMEANDDVQYYILSYLPLMNARKIKALQLRTAAKGNIYQDLPEDVLMADPTPGSQWLKS